MTQSNRFKPCIASLAVIRADVQIRQTPVKEERDLRADRVAIEQDNATVSCLNTLQFGFESGMVGLMPRDAATLYFGRIWRQIPDIDTFEISQRHQPGRVLPRIEADTRWVAIGVDEVAMKIRRNDCRSGDGVGIEPRQMPIRIGDFPPGGIECIPHRVRQESAAMRNRKNERRVSLRHGYGRRNKCRIGRRLHFAIPRWRSLCNFMLKHNKRVNMKMNPEKTLWAPAALLPDGWAKDVRVDLDDMGRIAQVTPDQPPAGTRTGTLLPAPVNLHSHAFQRAMAGLTEARGPDPRDTFWTWRRLMFRFLDHLSPEDCQAIAALVQMESLEAGYGAMVEFHYLHHQPGGLPYDNRAEMAERVCAAAQDSGIGLTLLPVLYRHGGCDRRPLAPGQQRFGNDPEGYATLVAGSAEAVTRVGPDAALGIAPHSLRAVAPEDLNLCLDLAQDRVIHMHLAEQEAEVTEVEAAFGARPVEWVLDNLPLSENWCFIHCTQMTPSETILLAGSGSVAGLCPITEASLGDGIFDGPRYLSAGGRFGIGSDSNIRISVIEELRGLEYSQRLRDRGRAILAESGRSTGRVLWQGACEGGAKAAGRKTGRIAAGYWADLVALDDTQPDLGAREGDARLDTLIFAVDHRSIAEVWSAGRHVVTQGRHISRNRIVADYRRVMQRLKELV